MLNWAARYFPIVRVLKQHLSKVDSILEIGSGSVGIGKFYPSAFVGCDLGFAFKPRPPMLPVLASATQLPFSKSSFDAVIASDVLEHIPPDRRMSAIRETLRVTRKLAIFGFPSGPGAFDWDCKLAKAYDCRKLERPVWLGEHLRYGFPDDRLFEDLKQEWSVTSFGNENQRFHDWVMRKEMHRSWDYGFRVLLAIAPRIMEHVLARADREPFYRRIVLVRPVRQSPDPSRG